MQDERQQLMEAYDRDPELFRELLTIYHQMPPTSLEKELSSNEPKQGVSNPVIVPSRPTSPGRAIEQTQQSIHASAKAMNPMHQGFLLDRPNNNSRLIPWLVAGTLGFMTLMVSIATIVQAIVGNSTNSVITRQQEANAAVMIEAARQQNRPNYTCILAVRCPNPVEDSGTKIQGDQMNVAVAPVAPAGVNAEKFQQWMEYWSGRSNDEIARAANTYTPEDCNKRSGMCEAMNEVKRLRGI